MLLIDMQIYVDCYWLTYFELVGWLVAWFGFDCLIGWLVDLLDFFYWIW